MRYDGPDPGDIELTGLTPGQWYDLRLYERAWDYQGSIRTFYAGYDVGSDGSVEFTTPKINQDDPSLATPGLSGDVSYAISYVYQADASGKIKVTIDLADDKTGTYHLYGLTNQELVGDSETEITMTATTATDASGVEYYFTETSGNPGGDDSGWQDSPTYTDIGLQPDTQYTYTVVARDKSPNQNVTAASALGSATTSGGSQDTDPPTPDPATFAAAAAADSDTAISMTSTTGTDASGPVEYLFTETSGNPGGSSSGWQTSPSYTDSGLSASTQYTYTVTMRDSLGNTGSASAGASATTQATPDTTPPTPDPTSFATAPTAGSDTAISMTATTGSDASGPVEYLFTETSGNPGGSSSSGWQTSPSYNDSGLDPDTQYTYTVTMRDSVGNTGTASAPASATTQSGDPLDVISLNFYAYGGLDSAVYHKVTLEAGESAGFGSYNTSGWENYPVPWSPTSPQSPVTITSAQGATASLTLNDVRNGGPYTGSPHSNFPGDGNGDLMDGHCNSTDDPLRRLERVRHGGVRHHL